MNKFIAFSVLVCFVAGCKFSIKDATASIAELMAETYHN